MLLLARRPRRTGGKSPHRIIRAARLLLGTLSRAPVSMVRPPAWLGLCRTCAKRVVICRSSPPCTLWTSDDLMKSVVITVRSYRGWPHDGAVLGVLDAHLGEPLDAKKTTSGAVRLGGDDQFADPSRHRHRLCRPGGGGSGPVPAYATWQACPDMIAQSRSILTMRDCHLQRPWARPAGPRRPHGPSKA
jgi:hypothetical protein